MAGTVYLRTDRFEVKLEGMTFKTKDFESLCKTDFLFLDGKDWAHRPIVGLDIMHHPRDPSIVLLLLCFGLGCVVLRFRAGDALPRGIHKFLADKRIQIVCFGLPEKIELFPFEELGLNRNETDIGYLAAKILKDPRFRKSELDELARKVLGIKRMIGLTEASSFERHEQIKSAICQLFITSLIGMGLLGAAKEERKKSTDNYRSKKGSFLKNLNSLHLLAEGWFKLTKVVQRKNNNNNNNNTLIQPGNYNDDDDNKKVASGDNYENALVDVLVNINNVMSGESTPRDAKGGDVIFDFDDEERKNIDNDNNKPIKGILKCSSTATLVQRNEESSSPVNTSTSSPPPLASPVGPAKGMLKRANSKGCNVSFKLH
ncbi:DNA-directed RNA polymerase subunit beta' [Striga asiatica]|uniref:DNA-directed RNA polymerase subunit beta n=1 Tax=Striga asiatica TaxID=4170 RepID=A0A5A7PG88_STRAF|nr:DNA-directed RNA polymerase subunit beta' [Striga asiatica]